MSDTLVITGIDRVTAEPGPHHGWTVRFRSSNAGLHHQLYVNGRLGDWTDTPDKRSFFLDSPVSPLAIRIAAVSPLGRAADLAEELPQDERRPPWVYRPQIVRSIAHQAGELVEILGDHATGDLSEEPLAFAEIWPVWIPRWAFGEDHFGEGGFGYDGVNAPGMGAGAFGAGGFGMDADLVRLEAVLEEEGTHKIVLRTRNRHGRIAESDPRYINVSLPGLPAASLTAVTYEHQTEQLTLQIE